MSSQTSPDCEEENRIFLLGKTKEETIGDTDPAHRTGLQRDEPYALAMNRLYQFIRLERPSFSERIDPRDLFKVFIVEPQQSLERVRAQSGAFLISAFHEHFEEAAIRAWNDGIPLYHHYTLTVPSEYKDANSRGVGNYRNHARVYVPRP